MNAVMDGCESLQKNPWILLCCGVNGVEGVLRMAGDCLVDHSRIFENLA